LDLEKQNLVPMVLLGLGYRSPDDQAAKNPKVRWPEEKVVIRID